MYDEFEIRFKTTIDRTNLEDRENFIKLPTHLVGIFNENPRILPRGTFFGKYHHLPRSRTMSMFSNNPSPNFCGSVPDLSRSVPTTPLLLTSKEDRVKLFDLRNGSSSIPRNSHNFNISSLSNNSLTKNVLKEDNGFLEENDKIIKIKMTSAISTINEEKPTILTTFKSSSPVSTYKAPETCDDIVLNRFSKKDEVFVKLRNNKSRSLLHSSSSFVIKRPSILPEINSKVQDLSKESANEKHGSASMTDIKSRNLAAEKAAALLNDVQPKLRASTKYPSTSVDNEEPYEGLILQNVPKYAIPRVITVANEGENMKAVTPDL